MIIYWISRRTVAVAAGSRSFFVFSFARQANWYPFSKLVHCKFLLSFVFTCVSVVLHVKFMCIGDIYG